MKQNLREMKLALKVNWKLSRNEALYKDNFVVELEEEGMTGLGEIAPNIRYGETPQNIQEQFEALPDFGSPREVIEYCLKESLFHSLKCGLECAATELLSKVNGVSVEEQLGLEKTGPLPTSISVPIMESGLLKDYISEVERFPYVKIKVNEDNAIDFVREISRLTSKPLRIDANEGFGRAESFLKFIDAVEKLNIQFVEQPFKSTDEKSYLSIRGRCPFEVMADESIEDEADFSKLSEQFDSINIKLMKTGGYRRAIKLIHEARKRKMKVMLGCMIESSLGISAAMRLGSLADYYDLDGSLLVKNDPFTFIQEKEGLLTLP